MVYTSAITSTCTKIKYLNQLFSQNQKIVITQVILMCMKRH